MKIEEILKFLNLLNNNNNKEWFNDNKALYEKAKDDFEDIVSQLIKQVFLFDPDIGYMDTKKCIFRIYRDVRFSKNKDPYKTNFGGFIVKGGRRSGNAGYYLHLQPGNSMIAGGAYMPENNILKNIRMDIVHRTNEFIEILENQNFKKTFGGLEGDSLKNIPKGFPEDFKYPDLIKYKSYTVFTPLSDSQINFETEEFIKQVVEKFKIMAPFIQFLNNAINLD